MNRFLRWLFPARICLCGHPAHNHVGLGHGNECLTCGCSAYLRRRR